MDEMKDSNMLEQKESVDQPMQEAAETTEAVQQAEMALPETADVLAAPKKKFPVVLLVVIAVLVVAAIGAFATGMFSSPEKSVRKAISATAAESKKLQEQMIAELPAYQAMYGSPKKASSTDFDLSLDSFQMTGMPADQAALINTMLKGVGVRGTLASDPENTVAELNGAIHMGDLDLLSLYTYVSPELAAFHVPTFSDTLLSVNPKTLAADLKNSPLGKGATEEKLQAVQESVNKGISALQAAQTMDYQAMTTEMGALLDQVWTGASYTKDGKANGLTTYTVTIPGANVKALAVNFLQYMYVDSPVGKIYQGIPTSALGMGGQNFAEVIDSTLIQPLRENMPELPATVQMGVDSKNIIQSLSITLEPTEDLKASGMEPIVMTMEGTGTGGTLKLSASGAMNGQKMAFDMVADIKYENGVYHCVADVTMNADGEVPTNLTEKITMTMDKDGVMNMVVAANAPDAAGQGQDVSYTMTVDGTIKKDGDKTIYSYPKLGMEVNVMDQVISYNFTAKGESVPLTTPYALTKEHKPLLAMNEEELNAELQKYNDGMNALVGKAIGLVMGGSMGSQPEAEATPETAPESLPEAAPAA